MHTGKSMAGGFDPAFYDPPWTRSRRTSRCSIGTGEILAVNDAWVQFIDLNDLKPDNYGIGCNYLSFCDRLGTPGGDAVAAGLRALIAGGDGPFRHEYVMPLGTRVALGEVVGRACRPSGRALPDRRPRGHLDTATGGVGLREATARLLHAEDSERRRIARELHDSTAQHLAGAKLMLRRLDAKDPVEHQSGS
jgi:two-component system NarL family sensor kinase